jgi:hypothetical protein
LAVAWTASAPPPGRATGARERRSRTRWGMSGA